VFGTDAPAAAVCARCAGEPVERGDEGTRDCPVDGAAMRAEWRSDVVIDVCPECGGVWLDPGELDVVVAAARKVSAERSEKAADLMLNILAAPPGRAEPKRSE
jgi:hypothetical protein